MRTCLVLYFFIASNTAFSDSIQKWTDNSGQIHYGDYSPSNATRRQKIDILHSFDEDAYKAAIKRNKILYKEVKLIEKRERMKSKEAKKRLNNYLKSLEKEDRKQERLKAKKRRIRESERNKTSIKVKRNKTKKVSAKKNKSTGMK